MIRKIAIICIPLLGITLIAWSLAAAPIQVSATWPAGFATEVVASNLLLPVDMEFRPNGDIFVVEKGVGSAEFGTANIQLIRNGNVVSPPVLTLSTNVQRDSGVLAIAFDPDFDNNGYFYLWYATGVNSSGWDGQSRMRLSRFTFDHDTDTAVPGSQFIMLQTRWTDWHQGNSLVFDADGNLYLGIGELATTGDNHPQDLAQWEGKVIRIKPQPDGSYTIPPDNPYINDPTALNEIYTSGVRNPFRIAIRPSDGLMALADVGRENWEEINIITPTANFGWPEREGPCPLGQEWPCPPAPPEFTDPVITYAHVGDPNPTAAVTGLTFYEGGNFPASYQQKVFFADYALNFIAVGDINSGAYEMFGTNVFGIVDLEQFGDDLYALDIAGRRIIRIHYTGSSNQAPSATLAVDVDAGAPALTVTFTATASDPDDIDLNFHWNFGDGSPPITNTQQVMTHTYTVDGTYTAQLEVTDPNGGSSGVLEQIITVYSGDFPTIELTNATNPTRTLYHGGDDIIYEAVRSDLSGLDPITPFVWAVDLHHNTHVHPYLSDNGVISGTLSISADNHDGDHDLWYEFILTMFTDTGQPVTVRSEILPELVDLTYYTLPNPVPVSVNGASEPTPYIQTSIIGIENTIIASPDMYYEGEIWNPDHWLWDGGIVTGNTLTLFAPDSATTYIANYAYSHPAPKIFLPFMENP